ncbi:WD domain, G-beta repeat [Plasmodiophora brassicae]|uniref:Uncharacterized protein n=1 Tax=Plasmodiophora brassicae TaxID=37360 RepID=A0A0G4J5K5_PLABS|nr:hypothetical protein PBRA_002596 [Plasmodiophora brassicae]
MPPLVGDLVRSLTLDQGIGAIDVSPDELRLATCLGRSCIVWTCHRLQIVARLNRRPACVHTKKIRIVRFTNVEDHVITICNDHVIAVWSLGSGPHPQPVHVLQGQRGAIYDCLFSADGNTLFTTGGDGRVRLWDWKNGQELASAISETCQIRSIAMNATIGRLACAMSNGCVSVWDLDNQARLCCIEADPDWARSQLGTATRSAWLDTSRSHSGPVLAAALSPNAAFLATGAADATVKLWSALSFKSDQGSVDAQRSSRKQAKSTVQLKESVESTMDDLVNGTESPITIGFHPTVLYTFRHEAPVDRVLFSRDSQYVFSCARDCTVKVWSTSTGQQAFQINLPSPASDLILTEGWAESPGTLGRLFVAIHNRVVVLDVAVEGTAARTTPEHVHKRVHEQGLGATTWPPSSVQTVDADERVDLDRFATNGLTKQDLRRAIAHRYVKSHEMLTALQALMVNDKDVRPMHLKTNMAKHSFADLDVLRAIATTTNFRFQDVILALSRSGELTDRAGAAVRNGLSLDNVLLEMGFTMDASDVLLHLDRAQLASLFRLGPRSSRSHRAIELTYKERTARRAVPTTAPVETSAGADALQVATRAPPAASPATRQKKPSGGGGADHVKVGGITSGFGSPRGLIRQGHLLPALAGTLEDSNAVDEDELPPVVTTGGTTARRHIS